MKTTRVGGEEYSREGSCTEKDPQDLKRESLWVFGWALMCMCVRGKYPRPGKKEGEPIPEAPTGLRIVMLQPDWVKRAPTTWGIRWSLQCGIAVGMGLN